MLKKVIIILLALILLVAPLVVRWLYYYEGQYTPGEVPRPDLTEIDRHLTRLTRRPIAGATASARAKAIRREDGTVIVRSPVHWVARSRNSRGNLPRPPP
jgi:hypothetical protein